MLSVLKRLASNPLCQSGKGIPPPRKSSEWRVVFRPRKVARFSSFSLVFLFAALTLLVPTSAWAQSATVWLERQDETREEGQEVRFTVRRTVASSVTTAVTVDLTLQGDFFSSSQPTQQTAVFTGLQSHATVSVMTVDDDIDEADGTVTATIVEGEGYVVNSPSTFTTTVADNDEPSTRFALTLSPDQVTEDSDPLAVTVTATFNAGARTQDTAVRVLVGGGSARWPLDYAAEGDRYFHDPTVGRVVEIDLTIPAESRSGEASFRLLLVDDAIAEGDERVNVVGIAEGLSQAGLTDLTLTDDDTASTGIELSLDPERVTEQGGQQTVTVTAALNAGARTEDTVVNVTVAAGTSTMVDDFQAVPSFNVTIPANRPSATGAFSLTPANDAIAEGDETLVVSGTSPLPVTEAELTLADDDTASTGIELSLDPERVREDDGATAVEVTATLDEDARPEDTVVSVVIEGGTAGITEDFAVFHEGQLSSLEVTISQGMKSGSGVFLLLPTDDGIVEGDETVVVTGTSALPVTPANLTIADDDTAATAILLSLVPGEVREDGGEQTVIVTAALDAGARTADTVVQVSVAGDTATVVDDFPAVGNFQITISANQTSGENTFSLIPVNDEIAEGDETLQVSGTSALPVTPANLTIADDDMASTVIMLTLTPERVSEGDPFTQVTVTAALDAGARTGETVVSLAVAGGTASEQDFQAVQDFTLAIPAGETSATEMFIVTAADDGIAEGDETLVVSGISVLPVTEADLTITDDDTASTGIELRLDPERVTEQGGQQTVTVTATLNAGARTENTVVNVSVAGGTATVVQDFEAVAAFAFTIPVGATSGEADFSLTPVNDAVAEGDETLQVSGTSDLPMTAATLTLTDDDIASTTIGLRLRPYRITEDGGAQTITVTAALNAGTRTADTVVNVTVAAGTALAEDFAAVPSFTVTIPAGKINGEVDFNLTPVNDAIAEGDETLKVNGSADGLTVTPDTLTITADDELPTVTIEAVPDPPVVTEGDDVVFLLTRVGQTSTPLTVAVRVAEIGRVLIGARPSTVRFAGDDETAELRVSTLNDLTVEANGRVTATIRPGEGYALTLDPERVTEQGGQQTVTVTAMLNAGARTADTVVQVTVAGNTATVVDDFPAVGNFQITISANQTSGEAAFSLTPVNDTIAEGDETLQVSGTATGLPVTPAALTIGDDDVASTSIALTLDPERVTEQGGQQTVTVTAMLNAGSRTADTVVTVSVAGNTATVVDDFAAVPSFNVTIPAGATSGENTFSLIPVNDEIAEGDETLQVSGTAALTVTPATLTISDDDVASTGIELSLDPERVTEQGGQQTVTVTAMLNAGARSADTVVTVSVAGNTATVVDDFPAVGNFQITISANQTSGENTFSLIPVNDEIAEGDETLQVSGTAALTVTPATLTISDDDVASTGIELSLDPERVTEQGGQQTVTVTAMLNAGARTADTVVQVTVAGNTAAVVDDFAALTSFPITIPANQTSGEAAFSLTPVNDTIAEGDETLQVSGTATGLPVTPAALTIGDDDVASTSIALTLDPERVTEQGGQQTVTVTAMLNAGARTADTVVQVTVAGNTAAVVDDFAALTSFPITIPANQTSGEAAFSLTPVNDTIAEGDETLQVSGTATGLPVTPAALTIGDDDVASTSIALTLDPERVTEQGGQQTVTVTAMLNAGSRTADTVVTVSVAGNTATVVDDFAAVPSFNVTIPAGATSGEAAFSLTPVNDTIAEGDETLEVNGTGPLPVTPAALTIGDDDTASTGIELSLDPERVTEQGGQQTVTVTAMLNAGSRTADTVVTVSVAGNTATVVDDFPAVGNFQVTITAGDTSGENSFSLTPVNDTIAEGDETLQVSGTATGLPVTPAALTIADDDVASTSIALTLDPERVTEQGGQQTVTVTAMLNAGARTADTVVQVTVAGNTAAVVDDFAAVGNFQITISANQTSGENTFSLIPVNDEIAEGDETLQVSGTAALTVTPATLTISDDDVASTGIELSLDPERVTEQGGQQTVTVTAMLNAGARTADTVVQVTVAGNTAAVVDDFAALTSFPITIPANQTSGEAAFSLTPVNDTIAEGDETLQVSGTATGLPVTPAALTIGDDDDDSDEPPKALLQVAIAAGTSPVNEGDPATFILTRTEDATEALTVKVNVSETEDMISSSSEGTSQVTFPAGASDTTLTVPTVEDSVEEEASTITVTVTAGGGYNVGDPPFATVIATDDDTRGVTLSKTELTVPEGGSNTYTVVLDSQPAVEQVTILVRVPAATDISVPQDQATLTFTPSNWNQPQTVTVEAAHDPDAATDPAVVLTHTVSGGDYQSVTAPDITVTITEDDTASTGIELSPETASGAEEDGAFDIEIRAELNAATQTTDTSVTLMVTGGTATAGTDYEAIGPLTITIPAEAIQGAATLTVTPVNDSLAEGAETLVLTSTSPSGLEVTPATVTVTLLDDDEPEIALSVSPTQISEADETSAEISVAITNGGVFTEDKAVVLTVAETSTATRDDDYTLGGTEITILAGAATGKDTVSLTAVDDSIDEEDETLLITATLDGSAVGDARTVTISDDDTRGVTLSKTALTVREGATASYTVALTSEPTTAVTVAVTVPAGSGLSVDRARLTFEAGNWSAPQSVKVTAAMNAAAVMDGSVTLTHQVSGGDYESVTAESVTVTVTGSDHPATRLERINRVLLPRVAAEMADSTVSAISDRIDAARGCAKGTSSLPTPLAIASRLLALSPGPQAQGAERRPMTLEQALGGTSFALPLNVSKDCGLGVWGSADYRSLSGRRGIAWNGDLSSFHLGVDLRVRPDLLAGLAVARHMGAFDYTDRTGIEAVEGRYKSRMTGVHPYVAWFSPDGDRNLWGTAGYGRDGIEIDDALSGRHASNIRMTTGAVGGSDRLLSAGTTALRLKGEGMLTWIAVEGGGSIEPLTLDVRRLRLLLEGSHEKELASGGQLTPSLEVGVRHDGGDGARGVGLEFGGKLRYLDPELGLTLEARSRWLAAHRDDMGEWGLGGMILFEPGADKRGVTFSLIPSWGETQSGTRQLWERGLTVASANDDNGLAYRPRGGVLDTELGYGLPVLSGHGLVTPYAGVSLGDGVSSGYGGVSSGCGGISRGDGGRSPGHSYMAGAYPGYGYVGGSLPGYRRAPGYGGGYGGGPSYGGPCCMDHPEGCLIIVFFNTGDNLDAT